MPSVVLLYRGSKQTHDLNPRKVLKFVAFFYKRGIWETDEHEVTYTHLTHKAGKQSYSLIAKLLRPKSVSYL